MSVLSAASAIFSIVSGLGAKSDAKSQARDAERLAQQNALNIESEGREEERRANEAQDEATAEMRARAAASGTKGTGSQKTYLDDQDEKFNSQIDWLKKSTKNQSRLAVQQGKNTAATIKASGNAAFNKSISSAVGSAGSAYGQYKTDGGWWG